MWVIHIKRSIFYQVDDLSSGLRLSIMDSYGEEMYTFESGSEEGSDRSSMDFDFSNLVVHPSDLSDLEMDFQSGSEDDVVNLEVHPQDVLDLELNPADFIIMDLEMESPNFEIEMVYESDSDLDVEDDEMEQKSDEENS